MDKKKIIIFSAITVILGGMAYFATKRRKIRFFDNVWCENDSCSNINPSTYVTNHGGQFSSASGRSSRSSDGNLNLVFPQPHGLNVGDKIIIEQDYNEEAIGSYNGETTVAKVYNAYVIRTNKARKGSTPIIGGTVTTESWIDKTF